MSFTATTTATTSLTGPELLAQLERVAELIRKTPPEPFGEWMRAKGCPPESWALVLPESMRPADGPAFWPSYVHFSSAITTPVLVRRR